MVLYIDKRIGGEGNRTGLRNRDIRKRNSRDFRFAEDENFMVHRTGFGEESD